MSIKSAQLYIGDGEYVEKESREITLTSEVKEKIDNIPAVVSTFDSVSETDALSAKAGKQLKDQLDSMGTLWKYLSAWDCATWLPATDPIDNPHRYVVWDYYVISNIGTWTKYKPDSYQYTHWVPSTAEEEWNPQINDSYYYDWTYWVLQPSGGRAITIDSALSSSSTNPVENRVINSALNGKQATISDLATIRSWAALGATSIQPGANISTLTNNSWFVSWGTVDSKIATATANFQTWSQVDTKIATATANFVTSNEVDSQISSALSTGNYTTASDVSSAISTATQWMVTETSLATKWYQTQWQVNSAISNATANMAKSWDSLAIFDNSTTNFQSWAQVTNTINSSLSNYATKAYVDSKAWVWDMQYQDFEFGADKSGSIIVLWLSTNVVPNSNFTIQAPTTLKDWQTYKLRIECGATAYTMFLWWNVLNPYWVDLTLKPSHINMFTFVAVDWKLELQMNPDISDIRASVSSLESTVATTSTSVRTIENEINSIYVWGAASDHLEQAALVWEIYNINSQLYIQDTPSYSDCTGAQKIWDAAADKLIHIQRIGSGVPSTSLKLKLKMTWESSTNLVVEIRKWIQTAVSSSEAYWYWDPTQIIAYWTIPYSSIPTSWSEITVTTNVPFWWTRWELLDVVLYQAGEIINTTNYYSVWYDEAHYWESYRLIKYDWTTYTPTYDMAYCTSDWFENKLLCKIGPTQETTMTETQITWSSALADNYGRDHPTASFTARDTTWVAWMGRYRIYIYCNATNHTSWCFLPWAQVAMADGTVKAIEEVNVWDKVLTYNVSNWEYETNVVTQTLSHFWCINTINVIESEWNKLEIAWMHPVYACVSWEEEYRYIPSWKIKAWDKILLNWWAIAEVTAVSTYDYMKDLYNIAVDWNHNCFVDSHLTAFE